MKVKIYKIDDIGNTEDFEVNAAGNHIALKVLAHKEGINLKDKDIYLTNYGIAFNHKQYTYWTSTQIK